MVAVTSNGKSVTQARFRSGTVEQVSWHHMSMMIDGWLRLLLQPSLAEPARAWQEHAYPHVSGHSRAAGQL